MFLTAVIKPINRFQADYSVGRLIQDVIIIPANIYIVPIVVAVFVVLVIIQSSPITDLFIIYFFIFQTILCE